MRHGTIRGLRSLAILVLDLVVILAVLPLAYRWRIDRWPQFFDVDIAIIAATFIGVLFIGGTYFRERSGELPSLPYRTFFVALAAGLLCILWLYLLGPSAFGEYFGRGVLPLSTFIIGTATTLNRFFVNRLYHRQESDHRVLYLGYSDSANTFFEELTNHSEVRSVTLLAQKKPSALPDSARYQPLSELTSVLQKPWQSIIFDPAFHPTNAQLEVLVKARLNGTNIGTLADYYEKNWFQVPVFDIDSDWFLQSAGFSALSNPASQRIKRLLDVVLSCSALIFSAPVIALCALAIKLDSKGTVFYSQPRVGLNGRVFTIYKLRTMTQAHAPEGAEWAKENDPRITRVGQFLRASRLDEIPQAWNVLKGEMSFIGPRPEQPDFTRWLSEEIPYYELRHQLKPGITGWAQVIFPYGASKSDAIKKLQYELYYIKHQSLMFDLNILVRTIITVFQRSGR